MPGNEVGDRIHNFLGQDNWSQGQHQSQTVDGTWSGPNNNPWAGSQRQIGTPLISNLKNDNVHQPADTERGGESSSVQLGMYFSHSNPRPEFARSQSQSQQPPLNGYMHGHQVLQTNQNEENFLGVDTESDRRSMTSKGFSMLDSQLADGPEFLKKNSARMDFNESPVNYDFFGGQQQISSQHPGMLQSFPRQQPGISDMQLLQHQFMLKKIQEMQWQQELQKQEDARKLNSVNQASAFAKQAAGNSQPLINGIPIHETSNFSLQPELMAASTNWPQQGVPPVMQGSVRGHMVSPEQGQALPHIVGMVPQQVDQSLYGVPISAMSLTPSQYSPVQMDKPLMQQVSDSSNSLTNNQYAFPEQVSVRDGALISRRGYQGKMIASSDGHGINSGFKLENLHQVNPQQNNEPVQEICMRQDLAGPSEISEEETMIQVAPSQNVATLDPTEAKILFGSDDNLWDAFGRTTNMGSGGYNMLDNTDFFSTLPSVQSGSWSALMQSAVAETSSSDTRLQEEWSGVTYRKSEPPAVNQHTPTANDISKQKSNWADNSLPSASSLNTRPFPVSHETNTGTTYNNNRGVHQSGVNTSHEQSERLRTASLRHTQQFPGDETKWPDRRLLQQAAAEGSHFYGKATHSSDAASNAKSIPGSWANQQSMPSYSSSGQPLTSRSGLNFMDSASPITTAASKYQENEKSFKDSQNADKKSPMFEVMGHGADKWKTTSVSNSTAELEHAKSSMTSPLVNQEDTNRNNVAALPDSSTERANMESSKQLSKSNNIDIWKHAGFSVNHKGNEVAGKCQPHMVKNDHSFESSRNSSLANRAVETQEVQRSNTKDNTTELAYPTQNTIMSLTSLYQVVDISPGNGNQEPLLAVNVEAAKDGAEAKFRIRNLTKVSDAGVPILNGINMDIPKGMIVGIIGPSGSGKSTVLRALNRLWEPPSGTVFLDGHDVKDLDVLGHRRKVGMLFQLPALFDGTVADNIRYGPQLKGKKLTDDEVYKLLSLADLDSSFYKKASNELSVGQAQRVALARTLANEPEVLLLDEPTSALDPISTQNIEDVLVKLKKQRGLTVVIVSHSIKQIQRIADVVCLLVNGEIVEVLKPDDLSEAKHPMAQRFLKLGS